MPNTSQHRSDQDGEKPGNTIKEMAELLGDVQTEDKTKNGHDYYLQIFGVVTWKRTKS